MLILSFLASLRSIILALIIFPEYTGFMGRCFCRHNNTSILDIYYFGGEGVRGKYHAVFRKFKSLYQLATYKIKNLIKKVRGKKEPVEENIVIQYPGMEE